MQITRDVVQGELEMTQAYTHVLSRYYEPLRVLGMPYLFRDYDHAEQLFNGKLGRRFYEGIEETSKIKGFGITYSGGLGVISTKDVIARDPAALDEMRILISRGRYARMAFLLGGSYVVVGPDGLVPLSRAGLVDAAETTVSCFDVYQDYLVNNVVNETHHFLLTSMVIINKEFYSKLPEEYQQVIPRVARETVVKERQWSIESTVASRRKLEGMGIEFVDLTPAEKNEYKRVLEPLYNMILNPAERVLVDKIRSLGATGDGLVSLGTSEDSMIPAAVEAADTSSMDTPSVSGNASLESQDSWGGCSTGAGSAPAGLPLILLALGLLLRREEGAL